MRLFAGLLTIMFSVCLVQATCRADTDYHCLNDCVRNGKTSTSCLSQCSYNIKPPYSSDKLENSTSHNPLAAPQPLSNNILLPPRTASSIPQSKDYKCVRECQRSGLQYQLCEQHCIKPESGQKIPASNK